MAMKSITIRVDEDLWELYATFVKEKWGVTPSEDMRDNIISVLSSYMYNSNDWNKAKYPQSAKLINETLVYRIFGKDSVKEYFKHEEIDI